MKDPEIREILRKTTLSQYAENNGVKVVEEMGLPVAGARVDVAVISNTIHGYEIKSASDTLVRLPNQLKAYSLVFDYLTIVTEPKYSAQIIAIIPEWVGVILCEETGIIKEVKPSMLNPQKKGFHIAKLLWKEELQEVLSEKGIKYRKSDRCWDLCENMERNLSIEALTQSVITRLKKREKWRVA